ncbi:unnamed protein product [Litomosoides sigmodontis]|uniref:Tropomodulin n=1 Tax=Litomosoides sigmodontis TaxID=42156 RepID=A0A3P6TEV0_LITSI|nr:unnamed protein product [Litomosoides sigmodontis]
MAERNEMMTDADLIDAIQALEEKEPTGEVKELLKIMSDNCMISWEEAEHIMNCSNYNGPIKSSLPQQTRPTEPDNDTDVAWSIQQLQLDDPKLKQLNLNNMKRIPIPQVKRLLSSIKNNTHLEKIALANMGLYDNDCEPIFDVVASNTTLKSINLETNYLSGDFFARLFKAALVNQTLEEVKAVNQGVTFATAAEREIIDAVFENRGLTKVSINLRLPEGRHKIENAMIRNQEIKAEEASKPITATAEPQKPQPMKPAILGNASQTPSARGELSHPKSISTGATSASEKMVSGVAGSRPAALPETTGNDRRTTSATAKQMKVSDAINRMASFNGQSGNVSKSLPIVDSVKTTSTNVNRLKIASVAKTNASDTTAAKEAEKVKLEKTVLQKKISLEQAVSELELNTEEVPKNTSVTKNVPLVTAENSTSSETAVLPSASSTSTNSGLKNNPCKNRMRNNRAISAEETNSAVPVVPKMSKYFDEKPIGLLTNARSTSLVPPIFRIAEQQSGPVKRNFSIPTKKHSSERTKIC